MWRIILDTVGALAVLASIVAQMAWLRAHSHEQASARDSAGAIKRPVD